MNDFADKALPLALQGYPVFPCIPSGEDAKRPLTLNGFKDATTDIAQINAWATVWPQALVGVPTGKASGLAVVDLDVKVSADGEIVADGFNTMASLPEQLPPTRTHKTKRGEHRLYRTNGTPLKCTTGAIGPGIDTRGEGGYIIWWPAEGLAVEGDELLPLPEWVISATAKPKQPEQPKAQSKQPGTGSRLCPLEQLPELLAHLDPDMPRIGDGEGWAVVGMGCKQAFGDDAYPEWLEWSKTGAKFVSERDCARQWKGFKDKPGGIGFGSVVDMAVAAGWKPAPAVVPAGMFAPVQPDARRQAQRDQNRHIGEGDEFDPFPEGLTVADMLKRFVFLADGSRVMDAAHPAHVLSFADFKNQTASCKTPIKTGEYQRNGNEKVKEVPNATLWIQDPNRQSAISTTFKAGADFYVYDPNGRRCVNLWAGFKQGDIAPQWAVEMLFVEHVRWLFGDRADDFLDWLAHIQQKPGELPHTAWLHISSHTGTGRNWVAGVLARVFAGHVAASLDLVAMLENGFNERLSRKVLAVVDEIRTGGNDQWNHAETMKQMVTAEVRNINTKYGRQSLEFNSCRWLLFSNHRSAIPITDEDRRFEVVISDQPPKDEGYYATLYAAMNDPRFIAGVAWYLSQRDLCRFNPGRHAKKDSAKQQVIGASQSDMVTSLKEFTAKYPFELVTASRLQAVAGETMFGQKVKAFSHAADDVGWVKLKQVMLPSGMRPRLYARKQAAKAWIDADGSECAKQLPKCDGGGVDWEPDL